MQDSIIIKGARVHNLKNIDVEIPRNTMTVVTGISGSGKSSLAFEVKKINDEGVVWLWNSRKRVGMTVKILR